MAWVAELAKILVGGFAADLIFHAGLLLSREQPKFFNIKFSNKMNSSMVVVDLAVIAVLAWLAWF